MAILFSIVLDCVKTNAIIFVRDHVPSQSISTPRYPKTFVSHGGVVRHPRMYILNQNVVISLSDVPGTL